jgi:hypothetical protein
LITYPNPVSDVVKIKVNITDNKEVTIRLIPVSGKERTTRSLGILSYGTYSESFSTGNFTNDVYFVEFSLESKKVLNLLLSNNNT